MSKSLKTMLCALFLFPVLAGQIAAAEDDPEQIIKYRQAMMKALSGHMAATAGLVRGKVSYHEHLQDHADAIAAISARVHELFPEGSDFGETDALDSIWEKPGKFEAAADKAAQAASDFRQAVTAGQGVAAAFKQLSETCKGCHKSFRQKE